MMSERKKASLLGEPAQIAVERALSEFRSGRPVLITSPGDAITALPVDGMTETMLVAFRLLSRSVWPFLLITARRARAIAAKSGAPLWSSATTSPSIMQSSRLRAASAIAAKSDVQSSPLRVLMTASPPATRSCMRNPSSLISCTQSVPVGGLLTRLQS
jgi:hypothetical protein